MDDILKRLEERDIAAWADAYSCRARGAEAAARIRELEAENAALREARGVRVKPLVWRFHRDPKDTSEARTQIGSWTVWEINGSAYCHGPNDTCGKPCEGGINGAKAVAQADYERRILAALEPAPVTPAEAARNDAKVALEHIEAVEDAYTRWMLAHAVGDANLIHRDSNALSHALFSMFNSDPDDGPSEVTRALRALADAGEAGNV